jgi:hypothetical protein
LLLAAGAWPWAPGLTLVPYALANLGASLLVSVGRRSGRLFFLLPVTFVCLHFPYGAGSLWGVVRVAAIGLGRMFLRFPGRTEKGVPVKA